MICPVRNVSDVANKRIATYVAKREVRGDQFHWPKRDTKQDKDPIGIRICRDNREAMFAADKIHIWYDHESRGSCFDMGMASMCTDQRDRRFVRIANMGTLRRATHSPQRTTALVLAGHFLHQSDDTGTLSNNYCEHQDYYDQVGKISFWCDGANRVHFKSFSKDNPFDLFKLGLVFGSMSRTACKITLQQSVEKTAEKSFNNLLLWLVEYTKNGPGTV